MSRPLFAALSTAVLFLSAPAFADAMAELEAFPPADDGMIRQVIILPEEDSEADLKVEIVAGKLLEVDCNRVMISARMQTGTVEGWGYDYHVISNISEPMTTMMACPDDQKEERFIPLNLGDAAMLRYNSKLPIVIYTPEELPVKYRIWRADEGLQDAAQE